MKLRMSALAVGAAALLTLAACVPAPPEVGTAPPIARQANLIDSQAQAIIADTMAHLAAADAALDVSQAGDRIAGDALAVRTAQLTVAAAVPEKAPDVLPVQQQAIYVSAADTWPRVLAAVSVEPDENTTPVVTLWVQDSIDTPYSLRGWAHMIPGASMPAMPTDVTGAQQLPWDTTESTPTPQEAVEGYLDFLRQGAASELASRYGTDSYAALLFTARDTLTAAAATANGTYLDTIESDAGQTYVLATADGGVLIFAPVAITSSLAVTNAKVSIKDADAALVDGTLESTVTHRYRDLVVLHIPAAGTGVLPTVVAADHHLVSVAPH